MTTTSPAESKNRLSELVSSAESTGVRVDLLASRDAAVRERAAEHA